MYDEYNVNEIYENNSDFQHQNNEFLNNNNSKSDVPDVPDTRRFNFNITKLNYKYLVILSKIDNKNMTEYLNDLIKNEVGNRWEEFKVMRDILRDKI